MFQPSSYRPVKQLFHHRPDEGTWGDCFRACIASLLGLPADAVPHFMDKGVGVEESSLAYRMWLGERGLILIDIPMTGDLLPVLETIENFNPGARYILTGHSRTGVDHCVICQDRQIIHDPSLTDAGIIGPCKSSDPELYWISFLALGSAHGMPARAQQQFHAPLGDRSPVVEEPRVPRHAGRDPRLPGKRPHP